MTDTRAIAGRASPVAAATNLDPVYRLLRRSLIYVGLGIAAFISIFPFYWMVIGATNTSPDIAAGKATPGFNLIQNIIAFFNTVDVPRMFGNSLFIALVGTALTLVVSSLAGYGFEVFKSRFRDRIFAFLLLMLSIPFAALMVPLYIMMSQLKLINSFTAVILPGIASIFIVFYFRQATKAFPGELRDAARIDGLKEWQIFLYVYLPVMRSTYAAAIIIVFMANWNNYLWPLIILQDEKLKTVTLIVSSLSYAYVPDYGVIMISAVLATLPTVLIFFLLQRRFVEGLLGSVK
ncbi:MAG TPA: carbohydrate ABC transporter permease [Devosia sp.]|nr:carbohydrate ABC transporter permease [Devosia sp.]